MSDPRGQGGAAQVVSVGGMATALGLCSQSIRNLEARGILPPASRLSPGNRRVWIVSDLDELRRHVEEVRTSGQQHGGRMSAA
ncbi:MAG: hypothetical protein M3Q71_21315 [Chloroflexota bacterium]|nr:hypothetical protein [Chloroflexota bacterium]MDP9473167.1 hypothetical protein [Chloroflexota bacterium]